MWEHAISTQNRQDEVITEPFHHHVSRSLRDCLAVKQADGVVHRRNEALAQLAESETEAASKLQQATAEVAVEKAALEVVQAAVKQQQRDRAEADRRLIHCRAECNLAQVGAM